jgi:hypothetical protein
MQTPEIPRFFNPISDLCFTRSLAVAAHNLHLIGSDCGLVIQLKGYVLDQEGPDFVAKSVCIEVALEIAKRNQSHGSSDR